jgi:lysophospholipase L1-like esterase
MSLPPIDPVHTLLAFGDSNTWGSDPGTGTRYPRSQRWPGALAQALGSAWQVVEAGLGGRTTVFEDPLGDKAGIRHLEPVLMSAAPITLVLVLLGTNDLKTRFAASAYEIAEGAGLIVDRIRASRAGVGGAPPQVLLIAPPPVMSVAGLEARDPQMYAGYALGWANAEARSRQFAEQYARVARTRGVPCFDAGSVIASSPVDGIHWSAESHAALAAALAEWVRARAWGASG